MPYLPLSLWNCTIQREWHLPWVIPHQDRLNDSSVLLRSSSWITMRVTGSQTYRLIHLYPVFLLTPNWRHNSLTGKNPLRYSPINRTLWSITVTPFQPVDTSLSVYELIQKYYLCPRSVILPYQFLTFTACHPPPGQDFVTVVKYVPHSCRDLSRPIFWRLRFLGRYIEVWFRGDRFRVYSSFFFIPFVDNFLVTLVTHCLPPFVFFSEGFPDIIPQAPIYSASRHFSFAFRLVPQILDVCIF